MNITYEEAIANLTSRGMFYIDLGLERIKKILIALGNPQNNLKCIHVAGTNGKGSVCSMLDSILKEAGYKTGLYTSPHIFEYTERIKISGIEIPKETFAKYFEKIFEITKKENIHLTEFEIITVIMFMYFNDENVDYVILETGMGGRLDATNVIEQNLCAIITQIDLDHIDRLGSTKDEIAYEKAGIIKKDCPVITSMGYEAIRDKADEMNSMFILTTPFVPQEYSEALALKGLHQQENLALVLTAINYLFKEIDNNTILDGLKKVKNPFRFEFIPEKNLIIDASHNPNGIKALKDNLDFYYPNQRRRFVFGCLKNKDYKKMMEILFEIGDEVYLNEFDYPNACAYEELKKHCPVDAKKYNPDTKLTTDKLTIICGSFYMLSQLLSIR